MMRMTSEFENELEENMTQFARIRLLRFPRFVLHLQKECFEFLF